MFKSSHDLVSSLCGRGVKLWVEDNKLRFQAPKGRILTEEIDELRQLKAEVVELLEQAQCASTLPLERRVLGCEIPLLPNQLNYWNYLKRGSIQSRRMCITPLRVLGPLHAKFLIRSIEAVVQRHESLRTRIVSRDGFPLQHVGSNCGGSFQLVDLSDASEIDAEARVRQLAMEFVDEDVDVSIGPLFATRLFKLSHHDHVLILALDHMISDDESNAILCREMWAIYSDLVNQRSIGLPQLSIQLGDYAVWLQRTSNTSRERNERYWRKKLGDVEEVRFPREHGLKPADHPVGSRLQIAIGETLSAKLRNLARLERTLLPMLVLAIFAIAVSKWCRQSDLLFRFVSNGRSRPELIGMIGLLARHIYLRISVSIEDRFIDVVGKIVHEFQATYVHDYPMQITDIVPADTRSIYFNWSSDVVARTAEFSRHANPELTIQSFPCSRRELASEFNSFFVDTCAGIIWTVEYRPDLLAEKTINWFGGNVRFLAEEFVRNPRARIASVSMLAN